MWTKLSIIVISIKGTLNKDDLYSIMVIRKLVLLVTILISFKGSTQLLHFWQNTCTFEGSNFLTWIQLLVQNLVQNHSSLHHFYVSATFAECLCFPARLLPFISEIKNAMTISFYALQNIFSNTNKRIFHNWYKINAICIIDYDTVTLSSCCNC